MVVEDRNRREFMAIDSHEQIQNHRWDKQIEMQSLEFPCVE
jgi:hypothetical protein